MQVLISYFSSYSAQRNKKSDLTWLLVMAAKKLCECYLLLSSKLTRALALRYDVRNKNYARILSVDKLYISDEYPTGTEFRNDTGTGTTAGAIRYRWFQHWNRYCNRYRALSPGPVPGSVAGTETGTRACKLEV